MRVPIVGFATAFATVIILTLTGCQESQRDETAVMSPPASAVASDPGVGPLGIEARPAAPDVFGPWQVLIVEGVEVEVPDGVGWRVDVVRDPCSTTLARWILMENKELDARIKVELESKSLEAEFPGTASRLDGLLDRVQRTLKGTRIVPDQVQRFQPFPTSSACDPKATGIPTLLPLPADSPGSAIVASPEPTMTPVIPPEPRPRP